MATPIDIRADHLRIVHDMLRRHLPDGVRVWVFGSRATWATKDSSDLDLALEGDGEIPPRSLSALEAAFEDSDLPYAVDVVDLKRVGERFRRTVEQQLVRLPESDAGSGVRTNPARPVSLRNLCEEIVDCPHSTPKWTPDGVIVLRSKNIRNGRLDLSQPSYTSEKDYAQRIRRATPRAGDLVITREAPMGEGLHDSRRVALLPGPAHGVASTESRRDGFSISAVRPPARSLSSRRFDRMMVRVQPSAICVFRYWRISEFRTIPSPNNVRSRTCSARWTTESS